MATADQTLSQASTVAHFGVLAFRPKDETRQRWQPLIDYLNHSGLKQKLVLEVYTYPELEQAIVDKHVDVVLTQPAHYILMAQREGLYSPLATLVESDAGLELSTFGGVIVKLASRTDIHGLADLRGLRIATSSKESLGGYLVQAYELKKVGIDAARDDTLLELGMPHDNAVKAVLDGTADIGFVRTGLLEGMARDGKLDLGKVSILRADNVPSYPLLLSTQLYPEWALAVMPWAGSDLGRQVATAALSLPHDGYFARAARIEGFTIPGNYKVVEEMMRALGAPPFDKRPRATLRDLWEQNQGAISAGFILVSAIPAALWLALRRSHRQLYADHLALEAATERSRVSSNRLKNILNSLSEGVFGMNLQGEITFVNPSALGMLGFTEHEVIDKGHHLFFHLSRVDDATSSPSTCPICRTLKDGQSRQLDDWLWHKDGLNGFPARVTIVPKRQDEMNIGAVVVFSDITNIVAAGKALQASEERLRAYIQNAPEGIFVANADGRYVDVNPAACRLVGYSQSELLGMGIADLAPTPPPVGFFESFKEVKEKGHIDVEMPLRRKDGSTLFVSLKAVLLPDGKAMGFVSDITELVDYRNRMLTLVQERTEKLLKAETLASQVLNSSADGLYGVDMQGRITFINPAACRMLGCIPDAVLGKSPHALFHHSRVDGSPYPAEECPLHAVLDSDDVVRVDDEVYWHADGHPIPVMYSAHPIVVDGQTIGAVTSIVDMTVQRAASQAREQALEAAETLARLRNEFLSNMSHELRTPMNGILGFAEIGRRNCQDSERAAQAFDQILMSGNHLLSIINDILDYSRIESGKLMIEMGDVDVVAVVDKALEQVRYQAEMKGLKLESSVAPEIPRPILGDSERIAQVLSCLLGNAVKFTERGNVSLSVELANNLLVFRVQDTGIGMTEEQMSGLFQPFQQADGSPSRKYGGTGLGLAIAKRVLDMMHGEIQVRSQPGAGSTFEFTLPYL